MSTSALRGHADRVKLPVKHRCSFDESIYFYLIPTRRHSTSGGGGAAKVVWLDHPTGVQTGRKGALEIKCAGILFPEPDATPHWSEDTWQLSPWGRAANTSPAFPRLPGSAASRSVIWLLRTVIAGFFTDVLYHRTF